MLLRTAVPTTTLRSASMVDAWLVSGEALPVAWQACKRGCKIRLIHSLGSTRQSG